MQLLFTVLSRSRDHTETPKQLKSAFRPSHPVEDWLCLRPFLSIEFSHTERLKLPKLHLRGLDRRTSHTIREKIAEIKYLESHGYSIACVEITRIFLSEQPAKS